MEQFELVAELEGVVVVWTIKHFRPYFYGHHCDVITRLESYNEHSSTLWEIGKLGASYSRVRPQDHALSRVQHCHERLCSPISSHSLEVVAAVEPTTQDQEVLFDAKVHGELSRQYWWKAMRWDIAKWTQECLIVQHGTPEDRCEYP